MRAFFLIFSLSLGLCIPGAPSHAQEAPAAPSISAFAALGLLPTGVSKRIAIIEGRDGNPQPERWYFVAYDPTQEHHLMEYVVSSGRVVAVHPVSQFAQQLTPEDILPLESGLMNSDRVIQIVDQFARANNLKLPRINLRLQKEGAGSAPLWKITCLDDSFNSFAGMLLTANGGTVLQTHGFQLSPDSFSPPAPPAPKPQPAEPVAVAQTEETRSVEPKVNARKKQGTSQASSPQKRNRAKAESRRQSKPEPVAEGQAGFFQSFRNLFQHPG